MPYYNGKYLTDREVETISSRLYGEELDHFRSSLSSSSSSSSSGLDFLASAAIGYATDSALLGGLLGGSFEGGIVGDLLDGDLFD
jgi:hypothetical protein